MNTSEKPVKTPENYSPDERPGILDATENMAEKKKYTAYKNIELRMDTVVMSESPDFSNIGRFHELYKASLMDRYAPYTEVGFSGSFPTISTTSSDASCIRWRTCLKSWSAQIRG